MSERDDEGTFSLDDAREEVRQIAAFLESPMYLMMKRLVERQIANRLGHKILQPSKGIEGVLEKEFTAGEVAGMNVAMEVMRVALETQQEQIEIATEAMEKSDAGT